VRDREPVSAVLMGRERERELENWLSLSMHIGNGGKRGVIHRGGSSLRLSYFLYSTYIIGDVLYR